MKELIQSATIARGNSDYVWHAKAMDYILVCLLMYAWAGMDFRVSLLNIDPNNLYKMAHYHEVKLRHPDTRRFLPKHGEAQCRRFQEILPLSL